MRDAGPDIATAATAWPVELMIWLSPGFPVGAFAYSHGLEYAATHLGVTNRDTLQAWITGLARWGSLYTDLILLAEAFRATSAVELGRLVDCNDLALALQPSSERHLETVSQGTAFMTAVAASWPVPELAEIARLFAGGVAYPVAVGAAAASHAMALEATLLGYGTAFTTNLVSAAIRLSVIGHTDGQRVIAALIPILRRAANDATAHTLDDLGTATFAADLASLSHETQYTRLFRS